MRISRKMKSILAFALAAVMVVGLMPHSASAQSIADGSKTATFSRTGRYYYLTTTKGTRLGVTTSVYTTNDGLTGPAYCIDHGLDYTSKRLEIRGAYEGHPETAAAFAQGYPQHSLETFLGRFPGETLLNGLTESEYAYATQLAVWATLGQLAVEGTAFTSGRETIAEPDGDAQQMRVFRAVQLICESANYWDKVPKTGMYIRAEENTLGANVALPADMTLAHAAEYGQHGIKRETIGGKEYYTREYTFASCTSTYYSGYNIELWAENAPAGTIFGSLENTELSKGSFEGNSTWVLPVEEKPTKLNSNGFEYPGRAKLCIPVDAAPNSGEVTVRCGAYVMQYQIYLAFNPSSTEQSYIIADPSKGNLTAQGSLSWGGEETETGALRITKTDEAGQPLAGAKFTLSGTDGSSLTGETDGNGIILWRNLTPGVEYTLTETQAPAGYTVAEAQKVHIAAGQITDVTVQDLLGPKLTVKKVDAQTGYSLRDAVIAFEQIDGDYYTTAVTDQAGTILMNVEKLPIGSYKVYEVTAPDGYELDTTPQTVHWDGTKDITLTFNNVRKRTIEIYKCDENNFRSLSGAVFEVYRNGQLVTTVTTNDSGLAYVPDVTTGYYTVKEVAAPDGYLMNDREYSVYVDNYDPATTDDPRITVINVEKPSLTVLKYDAQTKKPLPDTTFEVYKDARLLGTYTTDENGEIHLYDLDPGTYLVKEAAAPDTHVVNSTPQEIELEAGQSGTLVFLNYLKPGIRLVKLDSQTLGPLENARFRISQVGGDFSKEYTTDASGEIDLSGLEPGTYTVEELAAPDGYLIDDAQRIIKIEGGEKAQFVFTDIRKPSLKLVKTGSDGTPLAGIAFRLAKVEDGSHSLDRTTGPDGTITWEGLEPGVYSLTETATDEEHILDTREHHVELFPGRTSTVVLENQRRPNLTIHKTDADTGAPVPNTVFLVEAADGHSVQEITTGPDGTATVENLLPGVYEVSEKSVPAPYFLDAESQLVTLYPNRDRDVYFENHKRPSIEIIKENSVTHERLSNVRFQVWYASNGTETGEYNDLGVFTTDENGRIVLDGAANGLRDGWFRVKELEPPHGFAFKGSDTQEAFIPAGKGHTFLFQNVPLSALVAYKYDSVSKAAIEGCLFELRYLGGDVSGSGGTVIGRYKTGANGSFTVTGLKAGYYICEEVESDGDHVIDSSPQSFYISGKDQDVVTLYFNNSPKGSVLVRKVSASDGSPLSDVEFLVTTSKGTVVGNANGKYVTDSSGCFLVEGIDPCTSLVIKETRAKPGYLLDDTAQTVEVKAGVTVTLEFRDKPEGGLIVHKLSSTDRKTPLEGVQFKITYADGSFVDNKGGQLSSNGLYFTDENGQIVLDGVTGTLIVTEVQTIPGYTIDPARQSQTVVINPDDTQELWFYNTPTTTLVLEKYIEGTTTPLKGVTFLVTDSSGKVIGNSNGEFITDEYGRIVINDLTPGTTVVAREVKTVDGFILDTAPKSILIKSGEANVLRFYNKPTGTLVVLKLDKKDKTPLAGVEFEITYSDGSFVDADYGRLSSKGLYKTDANGEIRIPGIVGTVIITETKPLDGYVMDEGTRSQTVVVNPGDTQTITVYNTKRSSALIHKVDSETGKGIYGVTFLVSDAKGNPVGTYQSDNNGYVYIDRELVDGLYTIREIQCAEGYILDTQPKTVYVEYGGCATVEWKNTPATGQIQITKTSADYNSMNGWPAGTPIPGTVFEIYNARTGNLADTVVTNKNGVAASKPLPLGRYTIIESKAADFYALDRTPIEVEIEFAGQIVKAAMTNKSLLTNVSITKRGYKEVMPGQTIRYDFSGIANNSTVPLESFYWRDTLPTGAIRLSKIVTGTWSAQGSYKIVYKTNLSQDYRLLADNLSTARSYTLDALPTALGLAGNEYVTEFMYVFGIVPAGFRQVEDPKVYCAVLPNLVNGVQFTNVADVGGVYNGQWVMAVDRWVTTVYAPTDPTPLPRTGY